MPLRKALCPHCGSNKNIKQDLFYVNTDLKFSYCPRCGKKIVPYSAVENLNNHIKRLSYNADFTLFVKQDSLKAYKDYGTILSIDPEAIQSHYGRIISLIYSSTVHKSYFDEATEVFNNECTKIFHKAKDKNEYLFFLIKCNKATNYFVKKIYKKFTLKKCFYDLDCLKLYYLHLYKSIEFQKLLLNEANFLVKKYNDSTLDAFIASITSDIAKHSNYFETPFRLVDGYLYKLTKIKRNNEVVLENCNNYVSTNLSKYRMATLDKNNKNLRYIKDVVFDNFTYKIRLANVSLVSMITFYLASIVLCVLALTQRNTTDKFYWFASFSIICLIVGIIFTVVLVILIRFINKKKRELIS